MTLHCIVFDVCNITLFTVNAFYFTRIRIRIRIKMCIRIRIRIIMCIRIRIRRMLFYIEIEKTNASQKLFVDVYHKA